MACALLASNAAARALAAAACALSLCAPHGRALAAPQDPAGRPAIQAETPEALAAKARAGDAAAQVRLGAAYAEGRGVPRDPQTGLAWIRKAAEQGSAEAQATLGNVHLGRGEIAPALEMFSRSASGGDARGAFGLAHMYEAGLGLAADPAQAAAWYAESARRGWPEAAFRLAGLYARGGGVPRDPARAAALWREADAAGFAPAAFMLARAYKTGEGVERDEALALSHLRRAAGAGLSDAQYALGLVHESGSSGASADPGLAAAWYALAADQGHLEALVALGGCYLRGAGVLPDARRAVEIYRAAAERGSAVAQHNLGAVFEAGLGTEADPAQALAWYRKAAAQGDPNAARALQRLSGAPAQPPPDSRP